MKERIALHSFLALGLVLSACSKEEVKTPSAGTGEEICFSAYKNRIVTRSGDDWSPFDAGTKYDLYIIDYAATPDWTAANALLHNGTGTELADGTIEYGTPLQFPGTALNFYAVTDGTATKPASISPVGNIPTYKVELDGNGQLPDLMRAEIVGRDETAGNQVKLDFTHTLSKIRFEIAKQSDESPMNDIYIQSIALENMYSEGILSLETGLYTLGTPTETRTYYDRSVAGGKQYIDTDQAGIKTADGTSELEMLIFPREATNINVINAEIVIGKDGEVDTWRTVDVPIEYVPDAEADPAVTAPFEFKPNYEYVLTLMVTDNTVRLLVFETEVYEWIDMDYEENDTQAFLGKPISFAGLMWMDRNVGAKSADPVNDFDNCAGFYYQFGRSIPYRWNSQKNVPYTYGSDGTIIEGQVGRAEGRLASSVAFLPGDIPQSTYSGDPSGYKMISATQTGYLGWWLIGSNTNGGSAVELQTFWNDKKNQPCPEGWRMPVPEDIAAFMPDPTIRSDWYSAPKSGLTGLEFNYTNILNTTEDRIFGTIDGIYAIYMLKNKGTNNAYRIRIRRLESAKSGHYYYEVCRFPAENSDNFSSYTQTTITGAYDWDYPSEIMNIACSGYIQGGSIAGYGGQVMLRTSVMGRLPGGTNACYFRALVYTPGILGPGLQQEHAAWLGSQVRCVRDLNDQ